MKKIRVLYIEDEAKQRTALARRLRAKGFQVKSAPSGKQALRMFRSHGSEVVLCDLNMPGMGGLEVLKEIRKRDQQVPVILLTAHGTVDSAVMALKQGAYDFLLKPLEINKIVTTIHKASEQIRLQQEMHHSEASLKMLVETVPDIVYALNPKGEFLSVNPAGEALLGYKASEMLGTSVFDLIYPQDRDRVRAGFKAAMKHGDRDIRTIEFRMVSKSGEVKYFEVNRRLVFENGKPIRQDGIARDITKRVELKQELQKYSQELEKLVEERTQKLEYATRQLAALNMVSNFFTKIYNEEELLEAVPELLTHTLDFDRAVLAMEKEGELRLHSFCFEKDPPQLIENFVKQLRDGQMDIAPHFKESFRKNKTIFIPDLNADPRWPREPGQIIRTKAMVISPVRVSKKPVGVIIGNMQHHEREMDSQDIARFEMFASMVGLALENIRAYQTLERKVIERTRSLRDANKSLREKAGQLEKSNYSLAKANVQLLAAQEELQKLLKELSESEAQKLALLNAIPDLMFQMNGKGTILDFKDNNNPGPPKSVLGKKVTEIFPHELATPSLYHLQRALQTNEAQFFEYQLPQGGNRHDYEARMVVSGENKVLVIVRDITHRKTAEEALRKERNFVSAVLDTAGALVIVLDLQGRIIRFNRACEQISGYTSEEVEGKEFWDIFLLPDEVARVRSVFDKLVAGDFPNYNENYWLTKNGPPRLIAWSNTAIVDKVGKVEFVIGTGIDITERTEAAERLAVRLRYEEGLAACSKVLLEGRDDQNALNLALHHLLTAADVGRVYIFENFEDEVDGLCLRQLYEVCAPGVKPEIDNPALQHYPYKEGFSRWQEMLSRGEPIYGMVKNFPDGEREFLETQGIRSILVLPLSVEARWHGIIGFDDVKKQREWNEEDIRLLKTAGEMVGGYIEHRMDEMALRESEERFRNLVENANDIIYSLSLDGKFSYVSPNLQDILGYDVSEFVGSHFDLFIHPEDMPACFDFFRKVIETGEKQSGLEYRIKHKNGVWHWHTSNASALKGKDDRVLHYIGISRDITDKKKVLDDLEQANRHLIEAQTQLVQSEKMAALGMLVAGIAHEINTPIGAIHSMHDTLERAVEKLKDALQKRLAKEFEEHRELYSPLKVIEDATKVIDSGSARVTNIVRRLRSFARLDEAELKTVDIHEGLEDTLTIVHHEIKHNITVIKNYGQLPPVACYPGRLNQVFLNILINAKQAIQGKGEISITTYQTDNKVHIEFKDTGKGIAKEHLSKIFDPGFTTKGVGIGTGLGLSICYQIMQDHKGEILVESEVGKGSTFTVVFPSNLDELLEHT
jgi:PAS domain S-box-containing protein